MSKISNLINIVLISNIFICTAFAMEDKQDNSPKIGEKINNVPQEILAVISDYYLGNFPKNRSTFKEQYKKLLSLRLINKKFKKCIDENFCLDNKLWNKFENHLIELIKNESLDKQLNPLDLFIFAAKTGSKRYFKELDKNINNLGEEYCDLYWTLSCMQAFSTALENHYFENAKIILNKHILPNKKIDLEMQKSLRDLILENKDILKLDARLKAKLNIKIFIKVLEESYSDISKLLPIFALFTISRITIHYFFTQYF